MRLGRYKKRRAGAMACIVCAILAMTALLIFFARRAEPIFARRAVNTAYQQAQLIVTRACADTLTEFPDLSCRAYDKSGNLSTIGINSAYMNKLRAALVERLIELSEQTTSAKMHITFGSLLGCRVFQGAGVSIPIKVSYETICDVDFADEFASAGINQTKHSLMLNVKLDIAVVSAFMYEEKEIGISLPVYENIIIGGVPTYYLDRFGTAAVGEGNEQNRNKGQN